MDLLQLLVLFAVAAPLPILLVLADCVHLADLMTMVPVLTAQSASASRIITFQALPVLAVLLSRPRLLVVRNVLVIMGT